MFYCSVRRQVPIAPRLVFEFTYRLTQVGHALNLGTYAQRVPTACRSLGAVTVLRVVVPYSIPGVASPAERGRPYTGGPATHPATAGKPHVSEGKIGHERGRDGTE